MNKKRYRKIVDECMKLVISRNKEYGNSTDVVDIHTIVGMVIMKLTRIYKLGNKSKTEDELKDSINYLVFALEKWKQKKY